MIIILEAYDLTKIHQGLKALVKSKFKSWNEIKKDLNLFKE